MLYRTFIVVLAIAGALALFPLGLALAGSAPEEPPSPTVLPPDATQLETLTAALEKAQADKDDDLLIQCLIEMSGEYREEVKNPVALTHDSFIPHIKRGLKSKSTGVLRYAVLAAASHELKDEQEFILKLLKSKKKGKKPKKGTKDLGMEGVKAAVIEYIDRLAIKGHADTVFEEFLRPIFDDGGRMKRASTIDTLRAGVHIVGREKHKPAVRWLIDNLAEPVPANPNSGTNPPASYWEARYKLWQPAESWIRWALKEITGKEYRSVREWNAWYSQNKKDFK